MIKKILLIIRKNSIMFLGAALLAFGIFYVVNNPEVFMTSVLSLQEQKFIAEKGWDIAYKTNSGYVDIFLSEKMETPASIDFTISYDKDTVSIDPANLSGQGTRTYSNPDDASIMITSNPGDTVIKSESLIMLPFTWDIEDIILSEATVMEKGLSIWSLNEITSHSK